MSAEDISNIVKLPSRDQRLRVLSQTGLVRKWQKNDWWDGLTIRSGQITPPGPDGWSTPFPFELLQSTENPDVTAEVWEVLFSQNRIILQGDLDKSLAFLQDHAQSVKHIKTLDIQFNQDVMTTHWSNGPSRNAWQQISDFIAAKLNLEHLDLSLDAGPTYEPFQEMGVSEEDLEYLTNIYKDIVDILAKALAGKKPKSFWIYWVAFFHTEAEGEKQIMGQEYDSTKLGKIPYSRRSAYFPHGAPSKDMENPDGLQL